MRKALSNLALWVSQKMNPARFLGATSGRVSFFTRGRNYKFKPPTNQELLEEFKNVAWTCATINAAACAGYPPKLYVITKVGQPEARCEKAVLAPHREAQMRSLPYLAKRMTEQTRVEEVLDHPLLTLLRKASPGVNQFDLMEMTTLYQECFGSAYWLLERSALDVPKAIWILPSQNVSIERKKGSSRLVDYYLYQSGDEEIKLSPDNVVHFRYPDILDPYSGGMSPLKACFEHASLSSDFLAYKRATWDNAAIPSAIVSPAEVIGEEERDRLEAQWNQKFRRGGAGRTLFAESTMKVDLLSHSMGDLAALAENGKTKENIANAFGIPVSYLSSETNLANIEASEKQHALALRPRLQRRDEKINEQLVPLFDDSGRLFVASEDPVPKDPEKESAKTRGELMYGILTINEARQRQGLQPVPWGNVPWLPAGWWPSDIPRGPGGGTLPGGFGPPGAFPGTEPMYQQPPSPVLAPMNEQTQANGRPMGQQNSF